MDLFRDIIIKLEKFNYDKLRLKKSFHLQESYTVQVRTREEGGGKSENGNFTAYIMDNKVMFKTNPHFKKLTNFDYCITVERNVCERYTVFKSNI